MVVRQNENAVPKIIGCTLQAIAYVKPFGTFLMMPAKPPVRKPTPPQAPPNLAAGST
jgi:hypothetical protein